MYIEIDLSAVPISTELREPDDFGAFKVVVRGAPHTFVAPDEIKRLAGARVDDPDWLLGLERMLAFAGEHGWLDDAGAVRAHVESA